MIVPGMQRLSSNPLLEPGYLPNQRSVIARSVSNQVVPLQVNRLCHELQGDVREAPMPSWQMAPQGIQGTVDSPDGTPPSFLGSPPPTPPDSTNILTNTNYDLFCGYELLSKRKAVPVLPDCKDSAYWERRKRNNESAKRSREIRRFKELQTNKRILYLEQENVKLQAENSFLREEVQRLRGNELLPYLVRRCK